MHTHIQGYVHMLRVYARFFSSKDPSTKEFLWLGPRPILNLSSDIVIVELLHRVGLSKLVMALYLCLCGVAFLNFVKSDVGVVPKDMF